MTVMRYKVLQEQVTYTGRELRPGWVAERTGLRGDAAAGFVGPCHVANEDLVDLEDRRAGTYIEAASMAHIIAEHPASALRATVLQQRLLVCLLCDVLRDRGIDLRRVGDDVFVGARKLTVSIAAPARESTLIHLGINVRPDGAPVPAVGLDEMAIEPLSVVEAVLKRYAAEIESCRHAEGKVRVIG